MGTKNVKIRKFLQQLVLTLLVLLIVILNINRGKSGAGLRVTHVMTLPSEDVHDFVIIILYILYTCL